MATYTTLTGYTDPSIDWLNSRIVKPSGAYQNEAGTGFENPGLSQEQAFYGGLGDSEVPQTIEQALKAIDPTYDWTIAKARAAQAHNQQYGTGYNQQTPWDSMVNLIVNSTGDANIINKYQTQGQGLQQQLADAYSKWNQYQNDKPSWAERFGYTFLPVATAGLGAALAGSSAAAGGAGAAGATGAGEALGTGLSANAAGASGITAAAAEGGLGAGLAAVPASAPGLGSALGSGIGTAGAAGTSLAPGFFGSEAAALPSAGSAISGGTTGGLQSQSSGALNRVLDGTATTADYISLAGAVAPSILGAYGSSVKSDAYKDLANQYMAFGGPSRGRFEASFAPGFSMENDPGYKDALDQVTKAMLHKLSVTGNPAGSPNALAETLRQVNSEFAYPALQEYRRLNAGSGGLASFASAAPSMSGRSIESGAGVFDAIGSGMADIFNPPKSLEQVLKEMRRAGGY